jgi:hypothetical protein
LGKIETIKKNTDTLTDASNEVGREVNIENAGQNWDIKIAKNRLKMCHSSNIWKQHKQIKI